MALFESSACSKSEHVEIAVSEITKVGLIEPGFEHTIPDSKNSWRQLGIQIFSIIQRSKRAFKNV